MSNIVEVIEKKSEICVTWNGAASNSTTSGGLHGPCLDYFFKAGTYTNREQLVVDKDMKSIFSDDEKVALKILFGLRLISRTPKELENEKVQTGYGRRDEFYKGIVWLHNNNPELLYRNLHLIPIFGCWKDFLNETLINVLDKNKVFELFKNNLDNQLLRKYLPQIRSSNQSRSSRDSKRISWAKSFCKYLQISYAEYRKIKSSGTAHIWQQQMNKRDWDNINFNGIPGKAFFNHISQKGKEDGLTVFERHNQLERFAKWVEDQSSIKFTGYPFELANAAYNCSSNTEKLFYNKQFETVIDPFKNHSLGNVLSCIDTSGSMQSNVFGKHNALDICLSLGIVFSYLNVGYFKDVVVSFDNESKLIRLDGDFCQRIDCLKTMEVAWGGTNFQSVIDLLVKTRKDNPEIPIEDYPETILVVSDMQFNPEYYYDEDDCLEPCGDKTNYEIAKNKLSSCGLGGVKIIWWCVNGQTNDFPSKIDDEGVYMIGGFDPAVLKILIGEKVTKKEDDKPTPLESMMKFISQPIFNLIS